jgi:Lipase (class 3)
MNDTDIAEMLVLAGLTYRGFADLASGVMHEGAVRGAVSSGLASLPREKWELVWGPAAGRADDLFDSNAMYVVRNGGNPEGYVVAVRGTNPLSLSDWLVGDLIIGTTVTWPFATDGAAISTSTALGLRALLQMRSDPPSFASRLTAGARGMLSSGLSAVGAGVQKLVPTLLHADVGEFARALETQLNSLVADYGLPRKVKDRLSASVRVTPQEIESPTAPEQLGGETLLQFLAGAAAGSRTPLRVTVTGHSKGGALAPALALWLKEMQGSAGLRGWDNTGQATVGCVTFAGPTPGNAAFAKRIESQLSDHHRIANTNDIVTHGWEARQLGAIGDLYGKQSAPFKRLFDEVADEIANAVPALDYRHAETGVVTFAGLVEPNRDFVFEAIHQHLDAYLERFGLFDANKNEGINAVRLFLG